MAEELTDFARWLRNAATRAGYNPDERGSTASLARASGIDAGQMSRFLRGRAVPSPANIARLAEAVNVDPSDMARRIAGIQTVDSGPSFTPEAAAEAWGIRDEDRGIFFAVVRELRKRGHS